MFRIPLRNHDTSTFSEHGIRFGCVQGFYVTMDGSSAESIADSTEMIDNDEYADELTLPAHMGWLSLFAKLGNKNRS